MLRTSGFLVPLVVSTSNHGRLTWARERDGNAGVVGSKAPPSGPWGRHLADGHAHEGNEVMVRRDRAYGVEQDESACRPTAPGKETNLVGANLQVGPGM